MVLTNIERTYIKNTLLLYELYIAQKGLVDEFPLTKIAEFISDEDKILKSDLVLMFYDKLEAGELVLG